MPASSSGPLPDLHVWLPTGLCERLLSSEHKTILLKAGISRRFLNCRRESLRRCDKMEVRLTAAAPLSLTKKSVYLPSNVRSPQNQLKAHLVDWSNTCGACTQTHKRSITGSHMDELVCSVGWDVRTVSRAQREKSGTRRQLEPQRVRTEMNCHQVQNFPATCEDSREEKTFKGTFFTRDPKPFTTKDPHKKVYFPPKTLKWKKNEWQ